MIGIDAGGMNDACPPTVGAWSGSCSRLNLQPDGDARDDKEPEPVPQAEAALAFDPFVLQVIEVAADAFAVPLVLQVALLAWDTDGARPEGADTHSAGAAHAGINNPARTVVPE